MKYGPVGVSPGATIGDMITQSRMSQPKMQKPRAPKRPMNENIINPTVDFRPTPAIKPRGRMG